VSGVLNYIARSLYTGDKYMDVTLDEFRIYNGALNTNEISATQQLGADQLLSLASPVIGVSAAGTNLTMSWPLSSAGFTLMTTTNLASGNWVPASVTPQINGSQWQATTPVSGSAQYFRLLE
jgi:hypothetical protein